MVSRSSINRLARSGSTALAMSTALAACLLVAPAFAQDAQVQELRIRQLEAQVRDLLRQPGATAAATPAPTATTDMLTRMDALEAQVARLTAQNEELANRLRQLQPPAVATALPAPGPAAAPTPITPAPAATTAPSTTASNLAAMTGGASAPKPAPVVPAQAKPATAPAPNAKATAQRLAAVKAIVKPQTSDPADDEYSYGFRLWDAKFYPEAAQQLKLYLDKYPRHTATSRARNLLGRALLDDGKPREAAPWFLQNYKTDPSGSRAGDSLLNLADAMRQIGDTTRACIALNEFATNYSSDARGRLKADYDKLKGTVTCT